jgi:peptidoglycan/xylan/chitin deacetylase (PgdA/CDA1 family)
MRRLRTRIKRIIAFTLYYSGALWLLAALQLRDRAVVLMYHRVLPDDADTCSTEGIIVSPAGFDRQMAFLRRHFTPLAAEQFAECLERGTLPRRACLVTFDDGWRDNEQHALPILSRHRVPALLFIATGYVGTRRVFWQEELTRRLIEARRSGAGGTALLRNLGLDAVAAADDADARRQIRDYVTGLKCAGPAAVDRARRLAEAARGGEDPATRSLGDDAFLSWEAVHRLATSGWFSLGTHAHSHVPLTQLGRAAARADLERSLSEFAEHGLPVPRTCAYPNGDHDAEVISAAQEAGLRLGFTTQHGHVSPADEPLRLRRVNVHGSAGASDPEFLCRVLGLF